MAQQESIEILKEALKNLRKDRKEIYNRINVLTKESKTYSQPQKELSIAKSVAKLFEVLQKINSEIIKISTQIERYESEEVVFSEIGDEVYDSIPDEISIESEE